MSQLKREVEVCNKKKKNPKAKLAKKKFKKNNPKISLNFDGVLLKAKRHFYCKPEKIGVIDTYGIKSFKYDLPEIHPGEIVMLLGCWHYPIKGPYNDKFAKKALRKPKKHLRKCDIMGNNWVTSVRFLKNETIVKIEWVGIPRLEQLFQASKFLYFNFILA